VRNHEFCNAQHVCRILLASLDVYRTRAQSFAQSSNAQLYVFQTRAGSPHGSVYPCACIQQRACVCARGL